jgi:hypothetical protein
VKGKVEEEKIVKCYHLDLSEKEFLNPEELKYVTSCLGVALGKDRENWRNKRSYPPEQQGMDMKIYEEFCDLLGTKYCF